MHEIKELEDLTGFINDFLQDSLVGCRLEWNRPDAYDAVVVANFVEKYDFCDVALDGDGNETALEFLFHSRYSDGEPTAVSLPVDPDDVTVNILEGALEIESLEFYLMLSIIG